MPACLVYLYSDLTAVGLKLLQWKGRRERTDKTVLRCHHTSLPPDNVKPASFSLIVIYGSHCGVGSVEVGSNICLHRHQQLPGCELDSYSREDSLEDYACSFLSSLMVGALRRKGPHRSFAQAALPLGRNRFYTAYSRFYHHTLASLLSVRRELHAASASSST